MRHFDLSGDWADLRDWLRDTVPPRTGPTWTLSQMDDAPGLLGEFAWAHCEVPLGAICHRDLALPRHVDKRRPYGTLQNFTVLWSQGCIGGELVVDGYDPIAPSPEGTVVIFDGQTPHHVEPFVLSQGWSGDGGYRLGLTIYMG